MLYGNRSGNISSSWNIFTLNELRATFRSSLKPLINLIGHLQLGHHSQIMSIYNLENARNGKRLSKISKWPSLRPQALKNGILRWFELLLN